MLSNQHFYHRTIRKMVVAFGTMFINIRLVRHDKTGTFEIERITVPLSYINKEKFYKRITQDPELFKQTEVNLPRMGFELDSIIYDPVRKRSIYNTEFSYNNDTGSVVTVKRTPYTFNFTLNIYVRNVEDGTQIVEQILPYFSPDYTLKASLLGLPDVEDDLPLILNSVSQDVQDEGSADSLRVLTWTLQFTMQGYLYGPTNEAKIIHKATANTFYYNTDATGTKILNLDGGSVGYKIGELVYEGSSIGRSNATAYVESWDNTSNTLTIVDTNGVLYNNKSLHGAVSGATWNITRIVNDNHQLDNITVTPNPPTANVDDDYGFTTTIIETI